MGTPDSPLEKIIDYAEFKTLPAGIKNAVYQVLLGDAALENEAIIKLLGMEDHKTPEAFLGSRRGKTSVAETSGKISKTVAIILVKQHLEGVERLRTPLFSLIQFESLPTATQKEILKILYMEAGLTAPLIKNLVAGTRGVNFHHLLSKLRMKKDESGDKTISISEALDRLEAILAKHQIVYTPEPEPVSKPLPSMSPVRPVESAWFPEPDSVELTPQNAEIWQELENRLNVRGGLKEPVRLTCYEAENSNLVVCYYNFFPGGMTHFHSYNDFETHDTEENPSGDTVYIHVETFSITSTQAKLRLKQFLADRGFQLSLDESVA